MMLASRLTWSFKKPDMYMVRISLPGAGPDFRRRFYFFQIFIVLLFICAYNAWVISPPCPHPFPYHPLRHLPLPPPTALIPGRNYVALTSNFVEENISNNRKEQGFLLVEIRIAIQGVDSH
jgi:hypothetical protein